jgi:hypothetical protein
MHSGTPGSEARTATEHISGQRVLCLRLSPLFVVLKEAEPGEVGMFFLYAPCYLEWHPAYRLGILTGSMRDYQTGPAVCFGAK